MLHHHIGLTLALLHNLGLSKPSQIAPDPLPQSQFYRFHYRYCDLQSVPPTGQSANIVQQGHFPRSGQYCFSLPDPSALKRVM